MDSAILKIIGPMFYDIQVEVEKQMTQHFRSMLEAVLRDTPKILDDEQRTGAQAVVRSLLQELSDFEASMEAKAPEQRAQAMRKLGFAP